MFPCHCKEILDYVTIVFCFQCDYKDLLKKKIPVIIIWLQACIRGTGFTSGKNKEGFMCWIRLTGNSIMPECRVKDKTWQDKSKNFMIWGLQMRTLL